jgi:hypothetical protein
MRAALSNLSMLALAAILFGAGSAGAQKPLLGDLPSGSRSRPVHVIPLRDENGDTIEPNDHLPLPYSTEQTCGATCHDVQTIRRGWHFNAALPGVAAGRNGEPWLWIDTATATQIPLSYRAWPGTYRPQDVGIGARAFALRFGARTPAPIEGDAADSSQDHARWNVSGKLEANCLACHDRSPIYDQSEFARQLGMENFRYAATAASGMAVVTGSSSKMPGTFDYLLPGSVEDSLQSSIPQVHYAAERFLAGEKVAFDIARQADSNRCYYCHTEIDVAVSGKERWKAGEDVHMARGMACVQCHSNGLDHAITRNYEGDPAAAGNAFSGSLSCRGCHMGSANGQEPSGPHGLNAPYPKHKGLPALHLEKLSCTFCHAGPMPSGKTGMMKTARAHGLGEHNANLDADALPHIVDPVYAQLNDGKLAPYRAVWPAFWGRMKAGRVEPLNPESVRRLLDDKKLSRQAPANGSWPSADIAWVRRVLQLLSQSASGQAEAVYIAGGKLYRLDASGNVKAEANAQAEPYLWAIGHDVRPASQALGANGCQDCHSKTSPVFFGKVQVDSPLDQLGSWKMNHFQPKVDAAYQLSLVNSWKFRIWLKVIGSGVAIVLLLLLLGGAYQGLVGLSARISRGRQDHV